MNDKPMFFVLAHKQPHSAKGLARNPMPPLELGYLNSIWKPARLLPTEENIINESGKTIINNSEHYAGSNGDYQH